MNRGKVIIGCMGVLLMGTVAAGLWMQRDGQERIKALESELSVLRKQEEQSLVDRRVSQQLEKIAYGQEERAEERSREAIRQSEIAQEMTLRSEAERKRALQAQAAAAERRRRERIKGAKVDPTDKRNQSGKPKGKKNQPREATQEEVEKALKETLSRLQQFLR